MSDYIPKNSKRYNSTTHGMSNTPTYRTWCSMKDRCLNPNSFGYKDYGGRGIKVCERWLSFENFYEDMGERPKGGTIERKDYNGNYEPLNCTWATKHQQAINRRGTTDHVGIWYNKYFDTWKASMTVDGYDVLSNYSFKTMEEAFAARREAFEKYGNK